MKTVFLGLLLLLSITGNTQQQIRLGSNSEPATIQQGIPNKTSIPFFRFEGLLNAPHPVASMNDLKNKIVILEFWATWCGPCIPAMDHLNELQKKYPDQLQVIAVSDEAPERLERFIKIKPSSLWFLSDPNQSFQTYFPHYSIPHSVLIDQKGKLVANTSPSEISENIIEQLLKEQTVTVKEKKDAYNSFDFLKDYFPKPEGFNDFSFDIQPKIPGGFPITKRYTPTNPWYGRRLTMINNSLDLIYRNVYNKAIPRMIYEGVDKDMFAINTSEQFCLDVIVPKGKENEMSHYIQEQLKKLNLPYLARVEKRQVECLVFTTTDPSLMEPFRSKTQGQANASAGQPNVIRATTYHKKNVPIDDLLNHFEQFGIIKMPVVNETMIKGEFDLDFEFDAEDANSFKQAIAKLGLRAEKKMREVEMLIIYK